MDYKELASEIIGLIGGKENVQQLEHCSTRLRFSLNDKSKVQIEKLEKLPDVLGVVVNAQVQIVIGNNVVEVYNEVFKALGNVEGTASSGSSGKKEKLTTVFLAFLVGVFNPLIPAIAGAGILKSILIMISTAGWVQNTNEVYVLLTSISDATFYFLPLMVAVTTATKLNSNKLVALAAVGCLLLPANAQRLADGFHLFGITVKNIAYGGQIFPAILIVLLLSFIEKQVTKISPKPIRIFFVPMVALAITVPVAFLILGPLGFTMGEYLTTFILFIQNHLGWLSVAIVSAILPLMVTVGMHKALFPYALSSLASIGYEMLYLPASFAHNLSEAGACFAVALKTKNKDFKSVAMASAISSFMGITEPALFAVTIQNKRVLYSVMASGFISGGIVGILGIKSFVAAGAGVANLPMFIDPKNPMNIYYGVLLLVLALVFSFVFTFFLYKDINVEASEDNSSADVQDELSMISPIEGKIVPLSEIKDDLFSNKTLGNGFGIIPAKGELIAPADGVIKMVFETKHSIGMKTQDGIELLFHVGLDTVELNGKYFETHVKVGDTVKKGDLLLSFDIARIKEAGYDITSPIVITNHPKQKIHFPNVDVDSEAAVIL